MPLPFVSIAFGARSTMCSVAGRLHFSQLKDLTLAPAPYDLVAVSGARHVELETVADLDAVLVRAAHVAV